MKTPVIDGQPVTLERVREWNAKIKQRDARAAAAGGDAATVRALEEEFKSTEADGVDVRSALLHADAVRRLAARGIRNPTEEQYAEALAVDERLLVPEREPVDLEGAELHARATRLLRAAGRSMWTEEQYLEALKLAEAGS